MKHRHPLLLWTLVLFCGASNAAAFLSSLPHPQVRNDIHFTQASSSMFFQDDVTAAEEVVHDSHFSPTVDSRSSDKNRSSNADLPGVSMPLIRSICYNQASILLFATSAIAGASLFFGWDSALDFSTLQWSGTPSFHSLFDWNITPLRMLEGVTATIPLIGLGNVLEKSDDRDTSHVNFATTNMVIGLFGRRKSADDPDATSSALVMMLSLVIALSTGLSEELVFRGYTPIALASMSHSIYVALFGQAALFAFAHISPASSIGQNKVVGGLQFLNGLWYGLVYQITGGDIIPCIIAHMLYDMHVLCETWNVINAQMDYTQEAYQNKLSESEEVAIQRIQDKAGTSLNTETLNFARRFFYAFDSQHKGSVSLDDVQRAVSYAFLKDQISPEPEQVEDIFTAILHTRDTSLVDAPANRLDVSEFLRVLFTLKSKGSVAY
jgi:membrane protease YdiL (CAAX protease family)